MTWSPPDRVVSLPYPSLGPLFIGRRNILARIHDAVRRAGNAPITAQVIEGVGGVGKTRAAVEYAWAYQDLYTAVLFLDAETPDRLDTAIASQAAALGLAWVAHAEQSVKRNSVVDWLRQHPGWLLILDNVDTEAAAHAADMLLGQLRGGHVILTSRRHGFSPGTDSIILDPLQPSDAVAFLLARTANARADTPTDADDARALATALGGVPLALEFASVTIRDRACSFADYRREWEADRAAITGWNSPEIATYHAPHDAALQDAVTQLADGPRVLLERLAFLAPDPVPMTLLDDAGRDALGNLVDHGLATWDAPDGCFAVHRLVQDATRRSLEPSTARTRLIEALTWIDVAFIGDPEDVRTWPTLNLLAPHADVLVWAADRIGIVDPTLRLMVALGTLFSAQALYAQAEPLIRRALDLGEASYGTAHPNVAIWLNNLALLLQATNRLGEAEPLMRRAHAIDEASYGAEHPNVSRHLNNLARLLHDTHRLEEAEPLMRRALAIDEASYGAEHPDVAIDLNNLVGLLQATNRLAEAEPLMRRMVVIFLKFQRATGHPHPHRDAALANHAHLLRAMGRDEAFIAAEQQAMHREAGLA